ncbi:hypothetical protein [Actinoplanes sp. HUAS TT8]|uniref:hypothetical protein n=1 Tax=Actinoplanes sp. HUAS TT8 TaxID=3447453 RepID=UPI003F526B3F
MKSVTRAGLAALTISAALLAGCGSNTGSDATAAAPAAAASSAPAGNGIADLEAAAILEKAKTALKGAKSFHVKGTIKQDADKIELDLKNAGSDFVGSMTFGGATIELLAIGGHKYMRPDAAFWNTVDSTGATAKAMKQLVGTKWIRLAAKDDSFSTFFAAADIDELLTPGGTLSKGEAKTIEGVPAIGLKDSSDPDTVIYVATDGEPYPVKAEGPDSQGMAFSEFGKTFADLKAPTAAEFVDQSKIGK